jgi:sugar (pentulose or hexulose) kinase
MGYFAGIDLGTQGIRGMVADSEGNIIVNVQEVIPREALYEGCDKLAAGWHEQNPKSWQETFYRVLTKIANELKEFGFSPREIKAVCTDSTSGTILAVDESGKILTSAIMYNDLRSQAETKTIQPVAEEFSHKIGYKFNASFSLPKILWIKENTPTIFKRAYKFLHANDFLVGLLSDEFFHSDSSNCLKTGYDFIENKWPAFIEDLGIPLEKLPKVVPSGKVVAKTSAKLEKVTGWPSGIPIVSGATDSTMALIASGASHYQDIFSSLGTTLVTRALTQELIRDPLGRIYCHILPGKIQIFLPGGASSVGAECLQAYFSNINFKDYDRKALEYFPTEALTYPLVKKGERFPFINPNAEHFYIGPQMNELQRYAAYLQAVAFVERLSLEVFEELGIKIGDRVYTIGGATKSEPWLQIRADILRKTVYRPKIIEAAFGAAILAASTMLFHEDLSKASQQFVKPELVIQPRLDSRGKIEKHYQDFLFQVKNRFNVKI